MKFPPEFYTEEIKWIHFDKDKDRLIIMLETATYEFKDDGCVIEVPLQQPLHGK